MGKKTIAGLLLSFLLFLWTELFAFEWTYVSVERLQNADKDPNNWLMFRRTYHAWGFSPLSQINTQNVKNLVPKWTFSVGTLGGQDSVPVVNNGIMFITGAWNKLFALDARTGRLLWMYDHKLPEEIAAKVCCDVVNRGVALYGDKVYMATLDAHLLALDVKTGQVVWDVVVEDYRAGYTMTVAPLIVKGWSNPVKVVAGVSGGEFGIRGFVQAFDAETGASVWKTYTIPAPGEPGSETWQDPGQQAWQRGGGSTWLTGSYDPQLNLIYWGTGNAAPDFDGDVRPGDNLYAASMLALDADSGTIRWSFQFTPHDVWDYDGVNEAILLDDVKLADGRVVEKALIHADRNGYFYLLDRTNGKFLYAKPFVRVDWAEMGPTGRPLVKKAPKPGEPVVACPGGTAGKEWVPMAYSPLTGYAYVPAVDMCGQFTVQRMEYQKGRPYYGGAHTRIPPAFGHLSAIDVSTGHIVWQYVTRFPMFAGVVATAGGLVFGANPEGEAIALDARTGELLWKFRTGSGIVSAPITYAVDGKQYVALMTGWAVVPSKAIAGAQLLKDIPGLKDMPGSTMLFIFGLFEE